MVQCYNRADKEAASMDGLTHEKLLQIERNNPKETQLEKDMRVPVRKSNQLIQRNRFDMTVREQRLLLYCISRIKPTDKGGELYTVHIRDVCRASGIEGDIDGEAYGAVHEAVKKLDSYNFELKDDHGAVNFVHWIRDTKIDRRKGAIYFRFDPMVTPYLFNVRKYFTQYDLNNVIQLHSGYAMRLYELLKSYENIRGKEFTIAELRYLLVAENRSYDKYSLFKKYVLEPAVNEIKDTTDLKTDYIEIKKGRKVTGIKFVISDGSVDRMARRLEEIDRERHPERYQE